MTILNNYMGYARRLLDERVPDCRLIPAELTEQPVTEIACAMIFESVKIISKAQLATVTDRNVAHLLLMAKRIKEAIAEGK